MHIDNLNMFCQVIEEGSISQVARLNYVSQPAVTSKIQQLENHYGIPLFDRTQGKLTASEAGTVLYPYAKEILSCFRRSEEEVKQLYTAYQETLRIGASLTIGEYYLPQMLGKFKKLEPHIDFSLKIGSTPHIMASMENHDIDIALVEGMVTNKDFHIQQFATDELILIVPVNHPWNNRTKIHIEDILQACFIWREKDAGARKILENLFQQHGILERMSSTLALGSTQAIKSAVESGLGIGIVPKLSVAHELKLGVIKEVPIDSCHIPRDLWIVKRHERIPRESIRLLIDFIQKNTF